MITAAALCPWPPLLARELTGHELVLPELRHACLQAAARLTQTRPELVVVVGPGPATRIWPASSRLDLSVFAPAFATPGTPDLPAALGLGALLLEQAGHTGHIRLQSVGEDELVNTCVSLGAEIAEICDRVALLAMGDGSARRSTAAPGHLDQRAAAFDAEIEHCVRRGDAKSLQAVDPHLARELMATGRPAWQALSGALGSATLATEVLYADDPFGVAYLVAVFTRAPGFGKAVSPAI